MRVPALISVDWGTTAFRAYLIGADGWVIERIETRDGIQPVAAGAGFATVLARAVRPWRAQYPGLAILMSGMIGSRQGWREAPYVGAPAGCAEIAAQLVPVTDNAEDLGGLLIVPGVDCVTAAGVPDVMRGEETQVIGALAAPGTQAGSLVLPGTHAKWVEVAGGRIVGFRTYMTGEIYAALRDHTILGRLMADAGTAELTGPAGAGFEMGLAAARGLPRAAGALLHAVFSTRTLTLFDRLAPEAAAGYLSGLLIGAECEAAVPRGRPVTIVGAPALAARYGRALVCLGLDCRQAPADVVALGHAAIARSAGLIH